LGIDGDIAELGHTALPSLSRSDSANDNARFHPVWCAVFQLVDSVFRDLHQTG
jgi:hypothetical protein